MSIENLYIKKLNIVHKCQQTMQRLKNNDKRLDLTNIPFSMRVAIIANCLHWTSKGLSINALYGPFYHGALKLEISTLFTTFFLWTSFQFILFLNKNRQNEFYKSGPVEYFLSFFTEPNCMCHVTVWQLIKIFAAVWKLPRDRIRQ